jgi:hypothetical protein
MPPFPAFLKTFHDAGSYMVLFLLLMISGMPAMAQRSAVSQRCSFNELVELCDLREIRINGKFAGTSIRWKSDGKRVSYYFSECGGNEAFTYCKVKIVEDNGRTTYGKSEHGGRGTYITSSRGNKTWYPPF